MSAISSSSRRVRQRGMLKLNHLSSLCITTLALALLALAAPLSAGTGGPDAYGYSWIDNDGAGGPAFEWISPSADATAILSGNAVAAATIDLDVPWGGIYGNIVSQLRVSRNGFLTSEITDPGGDETNDCPLPATPSQGGGNRLYLLHDNLEIDDTAGEVLYEYLPASPHSANSCGVHVITWQNVFHATGDNNRFSFQALLFDNLDILFQYGPGNPENGLGSTTGIQNAAATIGLTVTCDAKEIPDDYAVLITPPVTTVTTEDDENDVPASNGDGISLREAIRDAASGTRIEVDPGLQNQTIDMSIPGGGIGGRIDIDAKAIAIDASILSQPLAISGGNAARHFYVLNGGWASFRNVRLEEGFTGGTNPAGSTRVQDASTLIACESSWQDNFAGGIGGALNVQDSSQTRFYLCDFFRNATNAAGGAISGRTGGRIVAEKCRFWRNTGGNDGSGEAGALSLNGATARLDFCDLALNVSPGNGGAVTANVNSVLNCYGCTFDNNRAGNGGAFAATNAPTVTGTPNITSFDRCTFYENLALNQGGAIYEASDTNSNLRAELVFRYCTMIENTAGVAGGGIYVTSDGPVIIMAASIMAYNKANITEDNFAAAGIGVIDATAGDNVESGSEGNFAGNLGVSNASPQFTPLGYFGGFVRTCLLLEGSVGRDQVQSETFTAGIDARGLPPGRFGGFALLSDSGAVEMGPSVVVTSSNPSGPGSIQEALDTVEDGGVVTFSGVDHIELVPGASGGLASLDFPTDKAVFLDGSTENTVYLNQLALNLTDGEQVGLHRIHATGYEDAQNRINGNDNICSTSLTLSHCRMHNYIDADYIVNVETLGRAAVLGTQIENNRTRTGPIYVNTRSTLVMRDSQLACNLPTADAGQHSVLQIAGGVGIVQRCSLTDNVGINGASNQGVVTVLSNPTRRVPWGYLENLTISGNRILADAIPTSDAGVIMSRSLSPNRCEVEIVHCTLTDNILEDTGGALLASSSTNMTVANTVVSGNSPAEEGGAGTITSLGANLSASAPSFFTGTDLPNTDPLLTGLALGLNGTLHHIPRPGSPCIDAGLLRDAGTMDGRGVVRFIDGDGGGVPESDIGAVESGRVLTVTTAADENDGGLGLGAGDSLRECIAEAANYSAVNVGFDAGLAAATLTLGGQITLTDTVADLDGLGTGITMAMNVAGTRVFGLDDTTALSVHGLAFDSTGGICRSSTDTVFTLDRCEGFGATIGTIETREDSTARVSRCHLHDNNTPNRVIWTRARSSMQIVDSAVVRNGDGSVGQILFQASNSSCLTAKGVTMAHNPIGGGIVELNNSATALLDRCTVARNGGNIEIFASTALRFRDSIFHNNVKTFVFAGPLENLRSLGGNISELSVLAFDPSLGDLESRCPYLAPLADYDRDGLPEMPPLAVSAIFNTPIGATDPPVEVVTVNIADDQDNVPAGAFISLREAIRDIAPGGTIVFDPTLDDANFNIVNNGGTIDVTKSMTIDASSLPHGVDTVGGRLSSLVPDVTLAVHAVHMRGSSGATEGGAIESDDGSLIASHCTFSANSADFRGGALAVDRGTLVAENCTFNGNSTSSGSAIYLSGSPSSPTTATASFCTYIDGQQTGSTSPAVTVQPNSVFRPYGSVFIDNLASGGAGNDISVGLFSGGLMESLGYNSFPDAPAGTVASDVINNTNPNYFSLQDRGGWVEARSPVGAGVTDNLPVVAAGEVPPPATDTRGYARIEDSSADRGAYEQNGEDVDNDGDGIGDWFEWFYGLNPNDASDASGNPDGDAGDNLVEFLFEKDPFTANILEGDPARITEINPSGSLIILRWTGTSGHDYLFEGSHDLMGFTVDPYLESGAGAAVRTTLVPTSLGRFWRARGYVCTP